MLPGEFFFFIFSSPFLFCCVFRVLIHFCLLLPVPFTLLSQRYTLPLISLSLSSLFTQPFHCFSPHGSPFPASYPFNHPLSSYPLLLPLSAHSCHSAFFIPTIYSTLYPHLQYFHSQITQKCSVIVPMSVILLFLSIPLAHSTLEQACLSV